ncbi:MAG: exopolysaccharide biosynthesis polyprenyl glycosylphosphotransferase [Actinomycetota bacterium]|nr:exopolysaccharide biosynthesis polyprenyl glycosylphosphotransferase [Actinomycetota bacterium]
MRPHPLAGRRAVLGGAELDLLDRDEALSILLQRLHDGGRGPLYMTSADLEHLHHFGLESGREGWFDRGRGPAEWLVLPTGTLARLVRRLTGRTCNLGRPQLLLNDLLFAAARARARVGFLGDDRRQLDALRTWLAAHPSRAGVAGLWALPPSHHEDDGSSSAQAAAIRRAEVDLLVVALGKPHQEEWLLAHGPAMEAKAAVALGRAAELSPGRSVRRLASLLGRKLVLGPVGLYRLVAHSRGTEVRGPSGRRQPVPLLSTPAGRRARLGTALLAGDAAVVALASFLAYTLRRALGDQNGLAPFQSEVPAAIAVLPLWLTILYGFGCYRPHYLNSGGEGFRRFAAGTSGGLLALGFFSFLFNLQVSRLYVAFLFGLVLALGSSVRLLMREELRRRRRRGGHLQRVLVVGADPEGVEVAQALARAETAGYQVVGFVDDELEPGTTVLETLPVLGRTDEVVDLAYELRAGLVLVSPTGVRPGTLRDLTVALEGSPIDLAIAPSLFQVVARRVTVESVGNVPLLHVDQIRLQGLAGAAKRSVDVVGALVLLVLLWPVMLAAAAAVKMSDGGSVLFRQLRVGRDGVSFTLLKFRTMVPDAEERRREVAGLNEAGHHFFKIRDDPRVTRVGRFLRKWSIDEIPQLWNVLRGDMSLVGPRPPLPEELEKYEPWHLRRLRVRPGITGIWQVSGRSRVPFDEAVRQDLFYIENWSLGLDIALLARTVLAVLGRDGAY